MAESINTWHPLFERLHMAVESGAMSLKEAAIKLSDAGYCAADDYDTVNWLIYINIKSDKK